MQLIRKFSAVILLSLVALCQVNGTIVRFDEIRSGNYLEFDTVYLESSGNVLMEQKFGKWAMFATNNPSRIDSVFQDVQNRGRSPTTRGMISAGKYGGYSAIVFDVQTMRLLADSYKRRYGMIEPSNAVSNAASKFGNYINEITTGPNDRYDPHKSNSRSNMYVSNSRQGGFMGRL